jgi:diketogulonate reductase-like aldo/keto reductase
MADKSRVPEYQVKRVLYYSQPDKSRVVRSSSRYWFLKLGTDATFGMRCDRAVREAVARGWCYIDTATDYLRPTDVGQKLIDADQDIENSTVVWRKVPIQPNG